MEHDTIPAVNEPLLAGEKIELRMKNVTLRSLYFIQYMSMATWITFFNIHLQNIGFSGAQIGAVTSLFQSTLFFVVPVWGLLADRNGRKKMFMIALFVGTFMLLGMKFIRSYALMLGYVFCMSYFLHPLGTLMDSLVVDHVKMYNRSTFGEFRVWASIGWAAGTMVMGRLLDMNNSGQIFTVAGGLMVLLFILLTAGYRVREYKTVNRKFEYRQILRLLKSKRVGGFFMLLFVYAFAIAPIYSFINLYYREIGASNQLIGVAFAVQALSELPFFFYGTRILNKVGARRMIFITMIITIVRMVVYSRISSPELAVGLGVFQGFTFSMFWLSAIDYVQRLIPQEFRATGQALLWAFHIGAGLSLGNLNIGWLSDIIRMKGVLLLNAALATIVMIYAMIYFRNHD